MDRYFTKILVVCLLGAAANFVHSQQEASPAVADIVISSGLEGGGYWNAGSRLQAVAGGMGLTVENHASTGSLINLKKLMDKNSQVGLAFAQADALQYFLDSNPDAAQTIETLENIGHECVFIISGDDSDIRTDKDMQKSKRLHLGIKSPNSGIRVTFDYMASLVPELRDISVLYGNAVEMMTDFAHPLTNVEKAVMIVHAPGAHSPEIDMVIANPDKYRFVEVSDKRLTRKTSGGEAVYRSLKVAPSAVADADPVQTICVQGLLLANKTKMSAQQSNKLTDLISNHWAQVYVNPD